MEWWRFRIMGKLALFIHHHSIIPVFQHSIWLSKCLSFKIIIRYSLFDIRYSFIIEQTFLYYFNPYTQPETQ